MRGVRDTTTKRKRSSATSTNAAIQLAPFGDEIIQKLETSTAINDYNHYIGGVDWYKPPENSIR